MILSTGWRSSDGSTDTAIELLQDAYRMSERLRLFGVKESIDHDAAFDHLTEEWKQATAHVAWGAYNWLT